MRVEHIMCDREGCKHDHALQSSLFKERKADGAGSSEDWHYQFELCPPCQQTLLDEIFEHVRYKVFTEADALALLNKLLIKYRVG